MKKNNFYIFDAISQESIDCIIKCFNCFEKKYLKDEVIDSYNDNSEYLGVICSGTAQVVRTDIRGNQDLLEKLSSRSVFGACLTKYSKNYLGDSIDVVCTADCCVLYISFYKILHPCQKVCSHHTKLIENLVYLMSEKTSELSQRIELLSKRSIRDKLVCYFNITATETGSEAFTLPFSSTTLASFLCVDRSAMMREIKKMKDENLIDFQKRKVTLLESFSENYS